MFVDRALSAQEPVAIQVLSSGIPVTGLTVVCDVIDFATNTTLTTLSLTETPALSGYYKAATDVDPTTLSTPATLGTAHIYKFRETSPSALVLSVSGVMYRTLETEAEAVAALATSTSLTSAVTSINSHTDTAVSPLATSTNLAALQTDVTAIQGTGFVGGTDDLHSLHALAAGAATSSGLSALQGHGDSTWATATGFATSSALATAQTDLTAIKGAGFVSGDSLHGINVAVASLPTASSNASAVWGASLSAYADRSTGGGALIALRKLAFNRLEEAPGNPGTLTLYEEDATTTFLTYELRDYQGNALTTAAGQAARRSAAA